MPRTKPTKVEVAEVVRREADKPLVIEVVADPVTVKTPVENLVEVALVVVEFPLTFKSPVKVEEALVKIRLEVVAETPAEG